MAVSSLGYVRIGMRDPQEWAKVGQDILGFESATVEDGSVRLRLDEAPFRYLIGEAEAEGFICAGWEYPAVDYDALLAALAENGVDLNEGNVDACAEERWPLLLPSATLRAIQLKFFIHGTRAQRSHHRSI